MELHRAQTEYGLGQNDVQKHKADRHGRAVAVGVVHGLDFCQHPARDRAEQQRADDLQQGVDEDRDHIDRPGAQRLGDAEGHGEEDQADRVVQGDDRQQQAGQRALGLVLAHDHQRGGRGRGGGDRAEGDGRGDRQRVRGEQRVGNQHHVDQQRGRAGLQHADDRGLFACFFQIGQLEFAADGKGDEAQRDLGDQIERVDLVIAVKADIRDMQRAEQRGADHDAGDQIGRHVGQPGFIEQTGHQQARHHGDR